MRLIGFTGLVVVLGTERKVEYTGGSVIISRTIEQECSGTCLFSTEQAMGMVELLEDKGQAGGQDGGLTMLVSGGRVTADSVDRIKTHIDTAAKPEGKTVAATATVRVTAKAVGKKMEPADATVTRGEKAEDVQKVVEAVDRGASKPADKPVEKQSATEPVQPAASSGPAEGEQDGDYLASDTEVAAELVNATTLRAVIAFLQGRGFTTEDQIVAECERLKATAKVPVLSRIAEEIGARVRRALTLISREV